MLMCSGVRDALDLVTVSPAVENTRSVGVDVAGTVRYLLATCEIRGK